MNATMKILGAAVVAVTMGIVLPGCESEMANIPGNAAMVASAHGRLTYTSPHNGNVFIYDKTWNKIVYSGEVKAGDKVIVDAPADKVLVDGRPVVEQIPLGEGSEYQIYLQVPLSVERRAADERDLAQ